MYAAESFAPLGLSLLVTETHGLRRGLHSSAASRLPGPHRVPQRISLFHTNDRE
jgi:hypothetical protein